MDQFPTLTKHNHRVQLQRCGWCGNDPLYQAYHDQEWGQPLYDEQQLFAMLCLEGQQAGLSWLTVLRKRNHYHQHFFQYPIAQIAALSDAELQLKSLDPGLIRHLAKLRAIRDNAQAWQRLKQQDIDPVSWLWSFSPSPRLINDIPDYRQHPAQTEASQQLSKALKRHGFKFIGPTICYAFMQAVGMVDDHENHCYLKSKQQQ